MTLSDEEAVDFLDHLTLNEKGNRTLAMIDHRMMLPARRKAAKALGGGTSGYLNPCSAPLPLPNSALRSPTASS